MKARTRKKRAHREMRQWRIARRRHRLLITFLDGPLDRLVFTAEIARRQLARSEKFARVPAGARE